MINLSTHYLNAKKTNPWERTIAVSQTKRKTKKKTVNEIFKSCAEHDTSEYWKSIFNNAAIGKFQSGYSFKNNILMCKNGNQVKELILPEDVEIAMQACKEFFNHNTGLISPKEKEEERKNERQRKGNTKKIEEVKVKKYKQSAHIRKYAADVCKKKGLGHDKYIEFVNFINYHLLLKNISNSTSNSHFEYVNGELVDIKNISYNAKEKKWEIDNLSVSKKQAKKPISTLNKNIMTAKVTSAEFDVYFQKEIDAIYKPKISEHKFIPQSMSGSNTLA